MHYIGQELYNTTNRYRVCAISLCSGYYAIADMTNEKVVNFPKPLVLSFFELEKLIATKGLETRDYELPAELSFTDEHIKSIGRAKWLIKRDSKWMALKNITSKVLVEKYLFGCGIADEIRAESKAGTWTCRGAYYNALNRFITMGMTINALLPVGLKNVGSNYKHYASSDSKQVKRGRKAIYGEEEHCGITDEIKNNILKVINSFKNIRKKFTLQHAFREYQNLYETTVIEREMPDGSTSKKYIPFPSSQTISYAQFQYHVKKLVDNETRLKIIHGHVKHAKDLAPRYGSARDGVLGATHRYEVDATVLDCYVAYPYQKGLTVGRPVLYLVIDVYSSMIVGMYLGFSGPDGAGVFQALSNACLNKVDYAKRQGLDIDENAWPVHHIPREITIDNGREYHDFVISSALKSSLGIEAVNIAAAYRGDAKGTVERMFGAFNDSFVHHQPGSIFKATDRTESHPSNHSSIEYHELVKKIILHIICHNKSANRIKKLGYKGAVDRTDITPEAIFLHSLQHDMYGGRPTKKDDEAKVNWAFLPGDEAKVTDSGIVCAGLEYVSEHPVIVAMFHKARNKRFKIHVKRLKDYVNHIWFCTAKGEFIKLELKNVNNTSPYLNMPGEIVDHRLIDEKNITNQAIDNARFHRAERNSQIENNRNTALKLDPYKQTVASTRKSTQAGIKDRKQEQHRINRAKEGAELTKALTQQHALSDAHNTNMDIYDIDNDLFG